MGLISSLLPSRRGQLFPTTAMGEQIRWVNPFPSWQAYCGQNPPWIDWDFSGDGSTTMPVRKTLLNKESRGNRNNVKRLALSNDEQGTRNQRG
jgi:hypothetical protein